MGRVSKFVNDQVVLVDFFNRTGNGKYKLPKKLTKEDVKSVFIYAKPEIREEKDIVFIVNPENLKRLYND